MNKSSFEVIPVSGVTARVLGTDTNLIDHYDWFQLTLGRFLAPAVESRSSEGGAKYLLMGTENHSGSGTVLKDGQSEVDSFKNSLVRLGEELTDFSSAEIERSGVLASLSAILQLRVPDPAKPEKGGYFLRGGLLQITGWGLEDAGGTDSFALGQLIGVDDQSRNNRKYLLAGIKKNLAVLSREGGGAAARASELDPPRELRNAGRLAAPVKVPPQSVTTPPPPPARRPLTKTRWAVIVLFTTSVMASCVGLGWFAKSRSANIKPQFALTDSTPRYGILLNPKEGGPLQGLLLKQVRVGEGVEGDYAYYLAQESVLTGGASKGQKAGEVQRDKVAREVVEQIMIKGVPVKSGFFDASMMDDLLGPPPVPEGGNGSEEGSR